jgi:hypothetical protein
MIKRLAYCTIPVLALLIASCTGKKIKTEKFDTDLWRQDANGCNGKRMEMLEGLWEVEDRLSHRTENEVVAALGSPDQKALYERAQKFYIYFVEPGGQCDGNGATTTGEYIELKFSSMNQVIEIALQQGRPISR